MGIKIDSDMSALMATIRQGGEKAVRGVAKQMEDEGEEIADLARQYAPVDEHNLENAIEVESSRSGVNRRTVVDVGVNSFAPVEGREDITVGDYAFIMHEGVYNLGPGSLAKDGGRGVVGPKYLERALKERERGLIGRLSRAAKRSL